MINWCIKKRFGYNKAGLQVSLEKKKDKLRFTLTRDDYVRYLSGCDAVMVGFDEQKMYIKKSNQGDGYMLTGRDNSKMNPYFGINIKNLPDGIVPSSVQGSYAITATEDGMICADLKEVV